VHVKSLRSEDHSSVAVNLSYIKNGAKLGVSANVGSVGATAFVCGCCEGGDHGLVCVPGLVF